MLPFRILDRYIKLLYKQIQKDIDSYKRKKQVGIHYPKSFNDIINQKTVFILSTGRCGTKWLTELLKKSQSIIVEHDPSPKIYFQSQYIYKKNFDQKTIFSSFIHARYQYLFDSYCDNKQYVETNNRITFYAKAIANKMPNSRFVHIVRHPYEVIRSGMRRNWYGELNTELSGHITPRADEIEFDVWKNYTREQKIAWLWKRTNEIIEEFKSIIGSERILTIKTSEMFQNDLLLVELLHFIGADDLTDNRNFLKITQTKLINKQKTGNYPEISGWDEKTRSDIREILKETKLYGFEL